MARLSTHVLDTSRGTPAAGVHIELHFLAAGERLLLATSVTNADGRTFHAGEYLSRLGVALTDPPFLGDIVIRVGIADPTGQYHVPLLLSPYGYSVYRGS